jgi:hypothetical protein
VLFAKCNHNDETQENEMGRSHSTNREKRNMYRILVEVVEVTLRLTVGQSICLGVEYPCGTCDQILFPVGMLLSEICGLVSIRRPL